MIPFWDVFNGSNPEAEDAWFKDLTPDVGLLKSCVPSPNSWLTDCNLIWQFRRETVASKVPGSFTDGVCFKSFVLNAPNYLLYLSRTLQAMGVPIIRKRLSSLDEAYHLSEFGPVDLVVNATGLGSYGLLGVHDEDCMPIRGQTVLVNAPGVKTCVMAVAVSVVPRFFTPRP